MTSLTRAERAIAIHVLSGLTNAQIAELRGVSVRTIANQLAAIYRKLAVCSRVELAAKASAIVAPTWPLPRMSELTSRERLVARRVALGDSNKLIATTLDLSETTISEAVRSAASKLGVRSRIELACLLSAALAQSEELTMESQPTSGHSRRKEGVS